jgi:hypothetical protein
MINEVHFARPNMPIRAILAKMRHDSCGGLAGKAELLTGIEGVSSRPVRKIVLRVSAASAKSGPSLGVPRDGRVCIGNPRTWRIGSDAARCPSHSSRNRS